MCYRTKLQQNILKRYADIAILARDVIYTSRAYAMMPVRLSVCLSVCL